jgi:MFS family permease
MQTSSPNTRASLRALAFGYLALATGLGANATLVRLREELHFSSLALGLHAAMFGLCLLPSGIAGPRLVAKVGERHLFLGSVASIGVGGIAFATAHHVAQSLSGALAIGAGSALLVVVIPGFVNRLYTDQSDHVLSRLNTWPALVGIFLGPLLALCMNSAVGWRLPLAGCVVAVVTMAVALGAKSLPKHAPSQAPTNSLTEVFRQTTGAQVRLAFFRNVYSVVVEFTFAVFAGTFLRELAHVSAATAIATGSLFAVGMGVSRVVSPMVSRVLTDRYEPLCYLGTVVAGLLVALPVGVALNAVGVALYGFSAGPLYVFGMGRLFRIGNNDPALAGLGALASGISITIGPPLLGILADATNWRIVAFVFPILGAIGCMWTLRSSLPCFGVPRGAS